MQSGDPSKLLAEELSTLLEETGKLLGLAFGAQDYSKNTDAMIALTWYISQLQGFREMLAMTASALDTVKTSEQFGQIGEDEPTPDRDIPLNELETAHDALRQTINRVRLAYDSHIIRNRPVKLLLNAADARWTLMTHSLNQAIKA